jgi:cell wall-associated NlpC family hydrolase
MSHWSAPFVGMPYRDKGRSPAGVDCWGVIHQVFTRHLGIDDFPSYADRYVSDNERREISAVVAGEAESPSWRRIGGTPEPFDVLFFRLGRYDAHAGLVVDGRRMLHMSTIAMASVIERLDSGRWPRILAGAYRWRGLEERR